MNYRKSPIERYCRQVKRNLVCSAKTKKELIAGLCSELQDQFPNCTDYGNLLSDYGYPEVIAGELQSAVELPEYYRSLKKEKSIHAVVTLLIIILCVTVTAGYVHLFRSGTVTHCSETITEDGTLPPDFIIEGIT